MPNFAVNRGYPADPHLRLAGAVLSAAVLDVRRGKDDGEVKAWLLDPEGGQLFADVLMGANPEEWQRWVEAGCPANGRGSKHVLH